MEKIDATTDSLKLVENINNNYNDKREIIERIINTGDQDVSVEELMGGSKGGSKRSTGASPLKKMVVPLLGDIVSLCAPDNPQLDNHIFIVEYISPQKIKLIETETFDKIEIGIDEDGRILEPTIIAWNLLSREDEENADNKMGYARLYGFLPETWVNVHFGGNIPQIFTGKITNLEEDMIEITPINKSEPIYIDFGYIGIPEDLSIVKIELREDPFMDAHSKSAKKTQEVDESESTIDEEDANIEFLNDGTSVVVVPMNKIPDEFVIYLDDEDVAGEEFTLYVEIPENEKRYGIEIQTSELLEKLLDEIPINKRTPKVLQRIHNVVERYKQLRKNVYTFDKNGQVASRKVKIDKPLVESLKCLDTKLSWIIPTISIKKKIYFSPQDELVDDIPKDVDLIVNGESIYNQEKLYRNSVNATDQQTLYEQYVISNAQSQSPFDTTKIDGQTKPVMRDQDFFVNNNDNVEGDFTTSVAKTKETKRNTPAETNIENYKVFVQKVLEPTKYLVDVKDETGQKKYVYKELDADNVNVISIVTLPEYVVDYSKINLPLTSILYRCLYSMLPHYYFNLPFNHKKRANYRNITLSQKDDNYENTKNTNILDNKDNFVRYNYSGIEYHETQPADTTNNYVELLKQIVPNNEIIISYLSESMNGTLSISEMLNIAEPYLIRLENINYSNYQKMKEILIKKIEQYIGSFKKNKNIYNRLLVSEYNKGNRDAKRLKDLVKSDDSDNTTEFFEIFDTIYTRTGDNLSSSELLFRIVEKDMGNTFFTMISFILYFLITPDKLVDTVIDTAIPIQSVLQMIDENMDTVCTKRIAKEYSSKNELENDNGKEIYFDVKFDTTPPEIYQKLKNDKKKYTETDFRAFVRQSLIDLYNYSELDVDEMVETIISRKKKVKSGQYAVLVEVPRLLKEFQTQKLNDKENREIEVERQLKKKYTYYKRSNDDQWIIDSSINDPDGKLLDTFCGEKVKTKPNITNNAKNQIDNMLYKTIGEKMKEKRDLIERLKKIIPIKNMLEISKFTQNRMNIGNKNEEDTHSVKQSPHIKLRQYILSEVDFPRKQQYIVRFYTKFCRESEPIVISSKLQSIEDKHWGYCRETNTKLFPRSLYLLAVAFINNNYSLKLDELIRQIGELSTDGDSVIDKYTGYVLKRVDDSMDEGYDEAGFKINTHSIIEKDALDVVLKELNKTNAKKFSNEIGEKVYNIFNHLKQKTGLKDETENIENFVMKHTMRFLCDPLKMPDHCSFNFNESIFLTEKQFLREEKNASNKNKNHKQQIYGDYMNRNIISLTVSIFLVAIQTSIPGIKPRNTFPSCQYSYSGFPMNSESDAGIVFLSCVVFKSSNNNNILLKENRELWKSIHSNYKVEYLVQNIRNILNHIVVNSETSDPYIKQLYNAKREYLLLDQGTTYNDIYQQNRKWSLFLPPLVSFSLNSRSDLRNKVLDLGNDFKEELVKTIKNGRKEQHAMLDVYKSKIKIIGFTIIERIRNVLASLPREEQILLKSFIQNGCCNENELKNPIRYFIDKDKEIAQLIVRAIHYMDDYTKQYFAKAKQMFFPKVLSYVSSNQKHTETKKGTQSSRGYTKELIYGAYIHYCNYDIDLPVCEDLKDICNKKPENYNRHSHLVEKIEVLEKANIIYNEDLQIHRLMRKINKRNLIYIYKNAEYLVISKFVRFIDTANIDKTLKIKMLDIISNCQSEKTKIVSMTDIDNTDNERLFELVDFLAVENKKKYKVISQFLSSYLDKSKSSKDTFILLDKIQSNNKFVNLSEKNNEKNYQFVRNSAKDLVQIYPNIILNCADAFDKNVFGDWLNIWNFQLAHVQKLNANYNDFYSELNKFFDKEDEDLHKYLNYTTDKIKVFVEFIELLPIYSEIEMNNNSCYNLFNKTSIDLILKYCWYSIFEKYIEIVDENQFSQTPALKNMDNNDVNDEPPDIYDIILPGLNNDKLISLKVKVAEILKAFLIMQQKVMNAVDYDYEKIKSESFKISEKEKDAIISRIGKQNKFEDQVDKLHRKLKLGIYYVEPNFHKNPYFFDNQNPNNIPPMNEVDGTIANIHYSDNERDEGGENDEIGNELYDLDDVNEDEYGETRFE